MKRAFWAVVLAAAVSVGATVVWRLQRRDMVERALGRDLREGMPLADVTAYLRRLGVEFTTDSTAEGTAVVRFGREVARRGRVTTVTEQQIVFDAQERLRDLRSVAQVMGHPPAPRQSIGR